MMMISGVMAWTTTAPATATTTAAIPDSLKADRDRFGALGLVTGLLALVGAGGPPSCRASVCSSAPSPAPSLAEDASWWGRSRRASPLLEARFWISFYIFFRPGPKNPKFANFGRNFENFV
jgi:hypothetical protein